MSEKKYKSQADKAATPKKGKTSNSAAKKDEKNGKPSAEPVKTERKIPTRLITSAVFFGLLVVFLVMFFNPEGALVKLAENFVVHDL